MKTTTARRVTIGGALTVAIATAIGVVLTPTVLAWTAIVIAIGIGSTFLSWGTTEAFKRLRLPPTPWGDPQDPNLTEDERQEIRSYHRIMYAWAMGTGLLYNALGGVVLTLVQGGGTRVAVVLIVLWFLYSALIAVSSPHTWRWTFEHLLPALNRNVDSHGVDLRRDPETGKIIGFKEGRDDTEYLPGRGPPGQEGHADWTFLVWFAAASICLLLAVVAAGLGFIYSWLWTAAIVLFLVTMQRILKALRAAWDWACRNAWSIGLFIAALAVLGWIAYRKVAGQNRAHDMRPTNREKQHAADEAAVHREAAENHEAAADAAAATLDAIRRKAEEKGNESVAGIIAGWNDRVRESS